MGFPFNLFSLPWSAHKDAHGDGATSLPEWLAALADDLPLVREEAFQQLEELLMSGAELAPAAALVGEPLLRLVESAPSKGRSLGAMMLANLALCARTNPGLPGAALLDQLEPERASLELLAARHDATTPFGAALRGLIAVIITPNATPQFVEQLAVVEGLVLDADAKDEAPAPTLQQVQEWVALVKRGQGHAVGLADRALPIDPRGALAILEADGRQDTTAVQQAHRAVLKARCLEAADQPITVSSGPWSRAAQALLLDGAERHCAQAPKVGLALLARITDQAHAVRRRAVETRVLHSAKDAQGAWALAEALSAEWLLPAQAGGVNQVFARAEVLALLQLFDSEEAAARIAEVRAAPTPEVAVPDGDVL